MSINVQLPKAEKVADKVLEFMTTYVQTHQVPHQELPELIEKLMITYSSPGVAVNLGNLAQETASVLSDKQSDISGASLLNQAPLPATSATPAAVAAEPQVKRGRGRPPKAYIPSPNLANISRTPKVKVSDSIHPDHLVCLIDGNKVVMIKRYLKTNFGITFEDYKRHFNLPADYPACSPNHSESKRQFAAKIGLGNTKAA